MAINLSKTAASKKLEQIAEKSVEEVNAKVVKDIPLELIDVHPDNSKLYSMEGIDSLKSSIEKIGFIGAIDVYKKPDGRYLICSGHRRYTAMKQLGRPTIPCLVYPMEDMYSINRKLVEANINTRVLSPIEKARQIVYMENNLMESGFTGSISKEIQEMFGISGSTIRRLKALTTLNEKFQEWAASPTFPIDDFYDAATLSAVWQERLYTLIEEELKRYPDAELSGSLVRQMVTKVKKEIVSEKQKKDLEKQRQALLQEAALQPPVKEQEIHISHEEEEVIIPIEKPAPKPPVVEYEDISEDEIPPIIHEESEEINLVYDNDQEVIAEAPQNYDDDMLFYLDKLEHLIGTENFQLSSDMKKEASKKLEAFIKQIHDL